MPIPRKQAGAFRLVVWNASMAVHAKLSRLAEIKPDIAVVPECASVEIVRRKLAGDTPPHSMAWIGMKPNKGLGVFGFGDTSVTLATTYDRRLQWVAPVHVSGPLNFTLLAVWAFGHRASEFHPDDSCKSQPQQALTVYRDLIEHRPTVLAGDFNNNIFWDRGNRPANWQRTVAMYDAAGFVSAYHHARNVGQGSEPEPTLYWMTRALDGRVYHIDYCFIPRAWLPAVQAVSLGSHADWVGSGLSDHVPLVVDLRLSVLSR